jgi:hypothetical protein
MSSKKKTSVGKARKTPTVKDLTREIRSDRAKEASLKHEAAAAKSAGTRKHDLAAAKTLAKKITSLKHERATERAASKAGLALAPGDVSCCAAQALAASLRLALGTAVHEEDVLALYWRTAADPDEGASILDTLRAAREYGLSGIRPASFSRCDGAPAEIPASSVSALPAAVARPGTSRESTRGTASLLLRLDLPEGPHAVTAAPGGTWWSWGEPYAPEDFAGAVIDQAWAVTW